MLLYFNDFSIGFAQRVNIRTKVRISSHYKSLAHVVKTKHLPFRFFVAAPRFSPLFSLVGNKEANCILLNRQPKKRTGHFTVSSSPPSLFCLAIVRQQELGV